MRDIAIIPGIEFKDDGEDYCSVTGYAAHYNSVDLGGDKIVPGAFSNDLKMNGNTRTCLWQHDSKQPIGKNTFMDMMTALSVTSRLPKDDDLVKGRVLPQLKAGSLGGYSIGYETVKSDMETDGNNRIRVLKECNLFETSLVSIPMNPKAVILSVSKAADNIGEYKTFGTDTVNLIDELCKTLNVKPMETMSDDTAWDRKRADVDIKTHNGGKECFIGEYPVTYWTEKGFKVVPRAVYSACASMLGTKDENIKSLINKLYKTFGHNEPFQKDKVYIEKDTLKSMTKKQFISIFENKCELSNSAKEFISGGFSGEDLRTPNYKSIVDSLRQERALIDITLNKARS